MNPQIRATGWARQSRNVSCPFIWPIRPRQVAKQFEQDLNTLVLGLLSRVQIAG